MFFQNLSKTENDPGLTLLPLCGGRPHLAKNGEMICFLAQFPSFICYIELHYFMFALKIILFRNKARGIFLKRGWFCRTTFLYYVNRFKHKGFYRGNIKDWAIGKAIKLWLASPPPPLKLLGKKLVHLVLLGFHPA